MTRQDTGNVVGVGVAHDGVAEQIGDDYEFRLHVGVNAGSGALVHLQHGQIVLLGAAEEIAALQKCGGDTGGDVGAGAVTQHAAAAALQNIGEQIRNGGFTVGAGNGDDMLGLSNVTEEIGAQPQCQTAGEIGAVVAGDLQRGNGQLGHPQREKETKFTHIFSPFGTHRSWFCSAIISAAMSAGETPEMRLACPRFSGRISASFSRASRRRP